MKRLAPALALVAIGAIAAPAQGVPANLIAPDWVAPFTPFKLVGNVYYVGTRGLACFLITSPQGHILIDTGLEQSAPLVLASVATLGFNARDIKIILSSHAHFDHVAGHAMVKAATGARVFASDSDATLLESGGRSDFRWGNDVSFPAVKVDHRVKDGETVALGTSTLIAHLTPGHTKGNTTWTMVVRDAGRDYNVVLAGSMSINPGVHMLNYAPYPSIGADYAKSLALLEGLQPDIFLAPHGSQFHLSEKARALEQGATVNPFIDPKGYRDMVAGWRKGYLDQVAADKPKP